MDELQMLDKLLTKPEPSPELINRGRQQLRLAMHEPPHRRPTRLLVGGSVGLAAATAAAVAVVISSNPTPPAQRAAASPGSQRVVTPLSGRQILLAAAVVAQARPAGTGTYWYVKSVTSINAKVNIPTLDTFETWIRRDGASWSRVGSSTGKSFPVERQEGPGRFSIAGVSLTFAQLQKLPTDPAKLTAWIVKARSNLHPSDRDGAIDSDLTSLLSDVPVPPSVRAAAFRALAARPNVKDLGPVTGGQALQIPILGGTKKLVVDPATSIVHSEGYVAGSGKKMFTKVITVLKAGWTNTLPKTESSPHK